MDVDTERKEPHRVEELWFEDGNLIIQPGNSQFRVYRGILATRSPVFQDMFAFPQPQDSQLVEGCPIVHLHDSPPEVTVFLKAIFDSSFFKPFPTKTDFVTIAGCLRLSHKYEVEYLRRRALVHLSSRYRTTLSEWDGITYTMGDNSTPTQFETSWDLTEDLTERIFIIQLAREVDAIWILPHAFLSLSGRFTEIGRTIFHGGVYDGIPTNLSAEDQESFLKGHNIQSQSTTMNILRFLYHPLDIEGCTTPIECLRERLAAIERVRPTVMINPSIPIEIWEMEEWEMVEDVSARQEFWNGLPELYGLPPWDELEKLKVAAIGTDWLS
ncbi:hypothetical protein B0H11DRAFT_2004040 [Mycena galericulata]|nr:hypothetical protein B0H11DRAFT_2004040 [Mycena galericulata]